MATSKKTPAKKVEAAEAATDSKKDKLVPKPITVVRKPVRLAPKKPEVAQMFENNSQDMAFSFAERMKKRAREANEKVDENASEVKLSRRPTTRAKGQDTLQFSQADLDEFRKRLIMLRQEALGQSAMLKTSALEQNEDHGGEEDDGADAFMRLQDLKQVDQRNKTVQQIDEALVRIAEGKYGICEQCGQLIRKPRLLNLPFVHTCMECQMAMEKADR